MRIGYRHADRLISYPDAHNLSVKQQPIRARRQGCNAAAGVKGTGGPEGTRNTSGTTSSHATQTRGSPTGAKDQAGVLVGGGRAWPGTC